MPSLTCCELQQTRWYYLGVIPSLMWPDCQLRAFNAKVTASPRIAPLPCSYGYPTVLVLLFGTTGRTALESVLLFPFMTLVRRGPPRMGQSSVMPPSRFGPYLFILGRFSLLGLSLGLDIKWVEIPRSFDNPSLTVIYQSQLVKKMFH